MAGTLKRRKKGGRGKRVCPACGRRFRTRPAMRLHLWAEGISAETGRPLDETEAALKRYQADGLFRIDPRSGDVRLSPEMGELGEDIREALRRIQEEGRDAQRSA